MTLIIQMNNNADAMRVDATPHEIIETYAEQEDLSWDAAYDYLVHNCGWVFVSEYDIEDVGLDILFG